MRSFAEECQLEEERFEMSIGIPMDIFVRKENV